MQRSTLYRRARVCLTCSEISYGVVPLEGHGIEYIHDIWNLDSPRRQQYYQRIRRRASYQLP